MQGVLPMLDWTVPSYSSCFIVMPLWRWRTSAAKVFGALSSYSWLWCLMWITHSVVFSINSDDAKRLELSHNMTRILNSLVHKDSYDKRLRPNYGGPAVDVNISMFVSSISSISEVEMDYTVDIYLRQSWIDPRLHWKDVNVSEITIDVEYMKSIWVPDTFFPNEKKSFFHTATTHNSFLRITHNGRILTSQRLTVTAACPMDLHYFPLDSQTCSLDIESYGYSTEDIILHWAKVPGKDPVSVEDSMKKLPTFHMENLDFSEVTVGLSTGNYSRLKCKFVFVRTLGFYFIQIYQPSMLVVVISWVTFWINRDSAPARVTLGIMTVLTMTTLMSTTNRQMPKVSYVKAVDVYLVVCYIMVFAALLEYAVVSYSNKKKQDINKRKQTSNVAQKPAASQNTVTPMVDTGGGSQGVKKPQSIQMRTSFWIPGSSSAQPDVINNATKNLLFSSKDPRTESTFSSQIEEVEYPRINVGAKKKLKRNLSFDDRVKLIASNVDKYSRMIFPAVFTIFNLVYWVFYLKASGKI